MYNISLYPGDDIDQDELERELEQLEQEELDKDLLKVGGTSELPEVPTAEPAGVKEKKKGKSQKSLSTKSTLNLFSLNSSFQLHPSQLKTMKI